MYPKVPYDSISWPLTQHIGVLNESVIRELLNACQHFHGKTPDSKTINEYLSSRNVFPDNIRTDSERVDIWRDYQQILGELGLLYTSRVDKDFFLTPIADAYVLGRISYQELMTIQLLRYQYPNGYKTSLSSSLKTALGSLLDNIDSFMELQEYCGILLRPAILVWEILHFLKDNGGEPRLTLDEMQTFVVKCISNDDYIDCAKCIIDYRISNSTSIDPSPRARRNMSDWIKLLSFSPLFEMKNNEIHLSNFSNYRHDRIRLLLTNLKEPDSYWTAFYKLDFKRDWFKFFGEYNKSTVSQLSSIFD